MQSVAVFFIVVAVVMAMQKMLQPTQRISITMCTVPSCVGRKHSHSHEKEMGESSRKPQVYTWYQYLPHSVFS